MSGGFVSATASWLLAAFSSQASCTGYLNQAILFNIDPSTTTTTLQNCLYL